jgi:hypothetical protein
MRGLQGVCWKCLAKLDPIRWSGNLFAATTLPFLPTSAENGVQGTAIVQQGSVSD